MKKRLAITLLVIPLVFSAFSVYASAADLSQGITEFSETDVSNMRAIIECEVTSNNVSVYESASTTAKKVGTVNKGDIVYWVSSPASGWAYILVSSGGSTGYYGCIQTTYIRAI